MSITDFILFLACIFILGGSIFLSFKTRFIQLRCFKKLFALLKEPTPSLQSSTISPRKALITAMSTTLGISTIVAPVIAIHMGGPGALLGFLLTSFFGSAATYTEVLLSVQHRKVGNSGTILGGPMQYIERILSVRAAKWYALCCLALMVSWSGAQANQLAAILSSPLLGGCQIPAGLSGAFLALFVSVVLFGGIRRVGQLSAKIVPGMFLLYIGASLWILFCNADKLGTIFAEMFHSALTPQAMTSGTLVGGIVAALRWGIFKGTQACEAGIGTQSIPHSMAETKDPEAQGALAMLSTYTAGIVSFIAGCVTLVTGTWQDPNLPLGISMVAASFQQYFSTFGIAIVALSAFLFGFGTIVGNSFNGGQCFRYLTKDRRYFLYLIGTTCMIFFGAIAEVKTFWSLMDLVLASMAIPHMATLILYAMRKPKLSVERTAIF